MYFFVLVLLTQERTSNFPHSRYHLLPVYVAPSHAGHSTSTSVSRSNRLSLVSTSFPFQTVSFSKAFLQAAYSIRVTKREKIRALCAQCRTADWCALCAFTASFHFSLLHVVDSKNIQSCILPVRCALSLVTCNPICILSSIAAVSSQKISLLPLLFPLANSP